MRISSTRPTTMDGIKRLAKTIKREREIPHHLALDMAALEAGYENIRHAQAAISVQTTPSLYTVFLTSYWVKRGGTFRDRGRETMKVQLARPLQDIIARHQLWHVRQLAGFRLESADHLERKLDVDSRDRAHRELFAAARALAFMASTGLRPVTTQKQRRPHQKFSELPGRDHESTWIHEATGAWVYMDEPYRKPDLDRRQAWAQDHGVQMLRPAWGGLYYPGQAVPYLFCEDPEFANRLVSLIAPLQGVSGEPSWDGESAPYFSQFVSPARETSGKARRLRPMPEPHGVVRNGALPYGARVGGDTSLWRPAVRMPLDLHLIIGPLFAALALSGLPIRLSKALGHIRSTLDDWLQMEYPGDEMAHEHFYAAYYGSSPEPIRDSAQQLETVRRIVGVLERGYSECKPRNTLLQQLVSVEAGMAGAPLQTAA